MIEPPRLAIWYPFNYWTQNGRNARKHGGSPQPSFARTQGQATTELLSFDASRYSCLNHRSPTKELVASGCESGDYNYCSYAILYKTNDLRILFAGDTHDSSWDHILKNHKADVANIDLLIAPRHGRDSDRDWSFLDTLNPSLTLFGNASSEHLAYSAFSSRGLPIITNNQAGNIIAYITDGVMYIYVTHKNYAEHCNANTFYADAFDAYYWSTINPRAVATGA